MGKTPEPEVVKASPYSISFDDLTALSAVSHYSIMLALYRVHTPLIETCCTHLT